MSGLSVGLDDGTNRDIVPVERDAMMPRYRRGELNLEWVDRERHPVASFRLRSEAEAERRRGRLAGHVYPARFRSESGWVIGNIVSVGAADHLGYALRLWDRGEVWVDVREQRVIESREFYCWTPEAEHDAETKWYVLDAADDSVCAGPLELDEAIKCSARMNAKQAAARPQSAVAKTGPPLSAHQSLPDPRLHRLSREPCLPTQRLETGQPACSGRAR